MAEAALTEDMIEAMRARAGTELRIDHSVFNEDVTRLAVVKFADGVGDPNPLWVDADHAAGSPYQALVAPPSFVIGCFSGLQFGWPGLGSFHSGTDLELLAPIYVGDTVKSSCCYDGFDGPKPGSFAGRMVIDRFVNRYHNQRHELVAVLKWAVINFERGAAKAVGREAELEAPPEWAADELDTMEQESLAETPRGATPRWWEDVEVGDDLDPILKGPVGLTDEIAFIAGGGPPIPRLAAHAAALKAYQRHPEWGYRDGVTGAKEPIFAVHYSAQAAQNMGAARSYDVGFQRQCWQIHLLSHWMGDHGWLKSCSAQYRAFVYLGDAVRLRGQVTAKYVDRDGEAVVAVATTALNQRGVDVMPGRAVIALPSRELGSQPVERRAGRP